MQSTNYFVNVTCKDTVSYIYIEGETIVEKDLTELNLIGCNINSCSFINTVMKSSDVNGTIINNCVINNLDWSYTDFCSITVQNSVFINVDFGMSIMNNCKFVNCKFTHCNFNHIAMNNNIYEQCNFEHIKLLQSSTYLNNYNLCFFSECDYDGNMYYNMFTDCQFVKTKFAVKLFSSNFWGQFSDFGTIGFDSNDLEKLQNQMSERNLLIDYVTLKLNLEKNYDTAMFQYIISIYKLLESDIFIRDEQINFIYNVLNYLVDNKLICPVTCVQMLSVTQHIYSVFSDNESFKKCEKMLNLLLNKLNVIYQKMGQEVNYPQNDSEDKSNIVKIIFEQEPAVEVCTLINQIKQNLKIDAPDAVRIKTEKGSFIEWIQCYESVLGCLQLFIDVLGLGITIHESLKRKEESISNDENMEITELDQSELLKIVNSTIKKQQFNPEVNTTLKIIFKNDIVAKNDFRGYKKSNIRSIEIISQNN